MNKLITPRSLPWIIFVSMIIIIVTAAAACVPDKNAPAPTYMSRYEDPDYNVTCWVFSKNNVNGVSCLPDSAFTKREK